MPSKRTDKVNELLRGQLATLITREVEFPKETVFAITRVTTSGDLKKATIYVRVFPDSSQGKCLGILKKRVGHIQYLLNQKLSMYTVPRIRFAIDKEAEKEHTEEEEIDKLFESIKQES